MWRIIFLVSLSLTSLVSALSNCPTSSCTCDGSRIICSSRNLRNVPSFTETFQKYSSISLDYNHITEIRDYDFINLATEDEFYIDLSNNGIRVIHDAAFSRLTNVTLSLNLVGNSHQVQPYLRNLTIKELTIDIVGTSLDATTMFSLGSTLEHLYIGMSSMATWPHGLRSLRHLKSLEISGLQSTTIPDDAFHGLENSLRNLTIRNSKLTRFPDAICKLRYLERLTLIRRLTKVSSQISPYCQSTLSSVRYLTVKDDGLTDFPPHSTTFINVRNLAVTGNPNLRFIAEKSLPNGTYIDTLNLSRNGFRQVPWSLRSLRYLRYLDLSFNEISTVEGNDFMSMAPLIRVNLSGNPLDYISDAAFQSIPALQQLDLTHTNLTSIPSAVLKLTSPTMIDLRYNQIECTCDLSWIKSWATKHATAFVGNCFYSTETISSFLLSDLKEC